MAGVITLLLGTYPVKTGRDASKDKNGRFERRNYVKLRLPKKKKRKKGTQSGNHWRGVRDQLGGLQL